MDRTFDMAEVQVNYELSEIDSAPASEHLYDHSHELTTNENLDGCERDFEESEQLQAALTDVDELFDLGIWKPKEPQYCKAICAHYGVKNRTVQKWFEKIVEACPWFDVSELRLPDDRYTPLCIELMGDYRASGLIARKWGAKMAERFAQRVEAWQAAQAAPAISPDVLPLQPDVLPLQKEAHQEAGSGGMVLHLGASLTLPSISEIVPAGNDSAYLTQAQQRLQEFEALQQQILTQMQQQYEQTQALNAQYREATSLSDQLLLKEFQLKGVQLGYTALQLKQQAFKATVQAAEAGTLSVAGAMPGKPPEDNRPQSTSG